MSKLAHAPRAYHVLDELGTRPGVTYLKKVVRGRRRSRPRSRDTHERRDARPAQPIAGGAHVAEPTFADVNRDVLATLRPPGNTVLRLDVRGRR